ncbi:DNA alkylation repair protein [Cohnella lubricantis]|uniref:DNA alkylation repair protein n=1 Tax=Cohnella lubricantis TaxID=2163172 RepID=A0A841TFB6_9BACL|nr:DNA alkylation repair protein [Cohnella lubricantis]MBB6678659.1 DNA alkylation repair protein [Cohnella lubricantis]MBP2119181.1 3-methyladenine DNA glycosylase AlkC [Cohnella lubricantis]
MAEPLKFMYDEAFINGFAQRVCSSWVPFDGARFRELVFGPGWDELELKGRMRRISESLRETLPESYAEALAVLESIAEECRGFPYLFFPDFVERYGLDDWARSIGALERFTQLSSAEFAVRPFIKRDTKRMMDQMLAWTKHPNEHVRRLASEGCRPRLPWAEALPAFKRDPSPILPILEALKADPSEYVRRSVANNLNDISKDHPDLVLELAARWHGADPLTDGMLRHGCRSLIRASAHPAALGLFGLKPPEGVVVAEWEATPSEVEAGGEAEVRYAVRLPEGEAAFKLRLELAVYYPRSGGKTYRKLFKLSERSGTGGELVKGARRLSFADLSTRKHAPGEHRLALVANGAEVAELTIELKERGMGG